MITVPEAARRLRRNPETIRRWIRDRKLPATKVGTQWLVEETDLDAVADRTDVLPAPPEWDETITGEPMPNFVAILRRQRAEH
jgi:excisionase family DNA binding protein